MKEVIIAEDIYALISKEQNFLSRSDIRIETAHTNSNALELHKTRKADLIIINLDTGDMSGEEFCSQLRGDALLRSVSILLVCSGQEEDIARCVKCNANMFISIPVNTAVLLQEAHRLLNIAPRKNCRVPVKIRVDGLVRGRHFTGMSENISSAGMLFWSSAGLLEGDTVQCTFSLSGSRQVTVSGEVVRVLAGRSGDESGYGVSFADISTEAASAIRRFASEQNVGCE
jgi:DNA-binding response OmpR family regulator